MIMRGFKWQIIFICCADGIN